MERNSGLSFTVAVSLITLLFSTVCSAAGIYAIVGQPLILGLRPGVGPALIGLGIVVWVGPPIFWLWSGRGSDQDKVRM